MATAHGHSLPAPNSLTAGATVPVRTAVTELGSAATPEVWAKVKPKLRQLVPDVVDHSRPFRLPRFQILAFRRVTTPRHRIRQPDR
jgi:hypothetical protein